MDYFQTDMEWYNFLAAFFLGAFLSNAIPHLSNGISGNKFPTPFSKPPGKGLSSPQINVLWAAFNLLVAWLLYKPSHVTPMPNMALVTFFAGFLALSLMSATHFINKDKE